MTYIDSLLDKLKKKRPTLSNGSITTYKRNLIQLHKKMFDGNGGIESLDFLKDKEKVFDAIKDMKPSSQKLILTTMCVFLNADDDKTNDAVCKDYRKEVLKIQTEMSNKNVGQHKTDKEKDNWVSWARLEKVRRHYRTQITNKSFMKTKTASTISNADFNLLQMWVVASLYTLHPPIRNNYIMTVIDEDDYKKISKSDQANTNYLVVKNKKEKYFVLNSYKTVAIHGQKIIPLEKMLNSVINIWLKFNDSGFLLLNIRKEELTNNGLTKLIQKTFAPTGKDNISVNMLRKIYLTDKYGDEKGEKEKDADAMMHSVKTQQTKYVKYDEDEKDDGNDSDK